MSNYWLIRMQNKSAYVWKRKYFLGLIAIPWYFHGGTNIIFSPDEDEKVIKKALTYIRDLDTHANITIETNTHLYKKDT